jgi:CheY-like chemotaxis protein
MSESPKLILCVEDDEDDCLFIQEAVKEVNIDVDLVFKPNGKEALKYLRGGKEEGQVPCLILMDMNMPILDGRETLKEIKKDPGLKHINVVVLTTSASRGDQLFCAQFGANMITKPNRIQELKKTVNSLVVSYCV